MAIRESLQEQIVKERGRREAFIQAQLGGPAPYLLDQASRGKAQAVLEDLIFFMPPTDCIACLEPLRDGIRASYRTSAEPRQANILRFLVDLTLSLRSFLPRWNLQNTHRYAETALTQAQARDEADKTQALATQLGADAPGVASMLLAEWRAETAARLKAEQDPDPEGEAKRLVAYSVGELLDNLGTTLASSHLRRLNEMRVAGETRTELSNDYAAFLSYALYLGASFVTCNPPLVDMAWVANPQRWNPVADGILSSNPQMDADGLARLMTMEVVLANMRLLRPIFLLTEGRMGCVCLQVNPHKHADAAAMISDALFLYEKLRDRLGGGVPNVVFKLPGTQGGLEACRALSAKGIGTTITVNFGMFQHLPFAEAIWEGQSIFSCLVEMNGRLAYPVRDELLSKLGDLGAYGVDEASAREAAAWAGIAVLKRLYTLLKARGYDLGRVKPLVASLRIYEGDGYQNLPSAFPDITEVTGASIISVFPNIRRPFDAQPQVNLHPCQIEAPLPERIFETLSFSQIFRQAYYVADRDWVADEDGRFRPDRELSLEDEPCTAAWVPVHNTLAEFCTSYDRFVQRILERKQLSPKHQT